MLNRRNTEKYKKIIELFDSKHTLSLAQISEMLPDIDFSTIYRNVLKGVKGCALRVVMAGDVIFYEKSGETHDHFICESCDDISAIHINNSVLKNKLPAGFVINSGSIIIRGLCSKCN